jgi:uncharacterized protein (DUF1778 family)
MVAGTKRTRTRRLELRTTDAERALIDRAVVASGTDITTFALTHLTEAAQRELADRDRFDLSGDAIEVWEQINARPARDLPGLRQLMERPSPFEA